MARVRGQGKSFARGKRPVEKINPGSQGGRRTIQGVPQKLRGKAVKRARRF